MSNENKRNIQFFEGASMKDLFVSMQEWQNEHNKRFLSMSVEKDKGNFYCIALTNPSEVIIVAGSYIDGHVANVLGGKLQVSL